MALRLMCITAHPDDESGAFGGALMQAHARGVETSVVCLTEGRAASNRGKASSDDQLAEIRRKEFARALKVLQVDHGEVLQYPDGALGSQDFSAVATELVGRIRRFRPQVVLTFGSDGNVNLHPDHAMACLFATAAFQWAGSEKVATGQPAYRPQKLYYSSPSFLAYAGDQATRSLPVTTASLVLDVSQLKQKKIEAFSQHTTQAILLERVHTHLEKAGNEERYLLVAAPGLGRSPMETDMFADVIED